MFKKILLFVVLALLLSYPVIAEDSIIAIVNGQEITLNELDEAANLSGLIMQIYQIDPQFTQLLFSTESGKGLLNEYRKIYLDQYIIKVLLMKEAETRGITLTEAEKFQIFQEQLSSVMQQNNFTEQQLVSILQQQGFSTLEDYREFFMEQNSDLMLITTLRNEIVKDVAVEDVEVEKYYQDNAQYFKEEKAVHARHILLKTREEAETVLEKIKNGADFVEMAKQYSTGPTGPNGGDLGFITLGQMVPEFEEAVFALNEGEISDIVQTEYGFHIIKVEEIRPESIIPFEKAKDQIKSGLLEQKKEEKWNIFVDELKNSAQIEIKL